MNVRLAAVAAIFISMGLVTACVDEDGGEAEVLNTQESEAHAEGTEARQPSHEYGALPQTAMVVAAPQWIAVLSEYCRGFNNVEWAPVAGATYYQVLRGVSVYDTNPAIYYSGPNTWLFVDVSYNSTWYFKVRACNAEGCSSTTDRVFAYYWYSYCQ